MTRSRARRVIGLDAWAGIWRETRLVAEARRRGDGYLKIALVKNLRGSAAPRPTASPGEHGRNASCPGLVVTRRQIRRLTIRLPVRGSGAFLGVEDFSQDAIGDLPGRWNTNASGEIVTLAGQPGRWLKLTKPGFLHPEFMTALPDNFTLEFDFTVPPNSVSFIFGGGCGNCEHYIDNLIVGHTDSDGDEAANLDLSKRQAASVKTALTSEFQIDAARMETDGKGGSQPGDKNYTPAGKGQQPPGGVREEVTRACPSISVRRREESGEETG